jgi:type IV secretory pathway VirB2 component (pilin)
MGIIKIIGLRIQKKLQRSSLKYAFILILLFSPTLVLADDIGGLNSDMLASILQSLITLLTSTYARLFMVIAIVAVGYLWMWKGSIPSGRAISTLIGIGIVFSASFLCTTLGIPGS